MDRKDNQRRLNEVFERYSGWLLGQARKLCRNDADAEDLVQETLTRFTVCFLERLLPCERVCSAWLTRTMTNLFISQCRKRQVHDRVSQDPHLCNGVVEMRELDSLRPFEAVTPELFARGVRALSPVLRETFELYYVRGMTYQQIARHQGIQVGVVAKRLHDARAFLRRYLLEHLHHEED